MKNILLSISLLLTLIFSFSQNLENDFEKGLRYMKKYQRIEAKNIFIGIVEKDNNYYKAHLQLAKIAEYYKHDSLAVSHYDNVAFNSNTPDSIKIIAHNRALKEIFKGTNECPEDAQKHIDDLTVLQPDNKEIILYRGICNYFAGNYELSLADLEEAYIANPKNITAIIYKSRAEIELENFDPAIKDLSRIIDSKKNVKKSDKGDAFFWRAYAHYQLANTKEHKHAKKHLHQALNDLNSAISLRVRVEEAYYDRAEVHFELGHYEEAISDFKKVISKNPKNMDARYQKAMCYIHYGKEYYAIKDLKYIVKMDDTYIDALYDLALIYEQREQAKTALSYINKVIALEEIHADAYLLRAEILYDLDKKEEACLDFKKADELGDKTAHKEAHKYCK